jgi:hypothetical protein
MESGVRNAWAMTPPPSPRASQARWKMSLLHYAFQHHRSLLASLLQYITSPEMVGSLSFILFCERQNASTRFTSLACCLDDDILGNQNVTINIYWQILNIVAKDLAGERLWGTNTSPGRHFHHIWMNEMPKAQFLMRLIVLYTKMKSTNI